MSGPRFRSLLGAELLKVRTTRMTFGLMAGVIAYVALGVVAQIFATRQGGLDVPRPETEAGVRNVYASVGAAYVFALVIGILGMTQELRFQTITGTFLAAPRRARVMGAKMAAYFLVGAGYGVVAVAFGYLLASGLLRFKDHATVTGGTLLAIAAGAVLGCALFALLGVAVGALIRNQVAAVLGALVWVLLIEALLVAFLPSVGKWLPGGAINGVLQSTGASNASYLPVAGAVLLLLAYAAVFGVVAARTTLRRDVT